VPELPEDSIFATQKGALLRPPVRAGQGREEYPYYRLPRQLEFGEDTL